VTFSTADVTAGHGLTRGTYYVETRWNDTDKAWQFRRADASGNAVSAANSGGAGFTPNWQNIQDVTAGSDGRRVFHSGTGLVIEFGAEYQSGSLGTGGAARLLLGVPDAQVSLTFDGGDQTADGLGDTLQIAGDGYAMGALYQPNSGAPGAGTVTVFGNALTFRGVEPAIVHGLPDFQMLTPNRNAALTIDSAPLANVSREQLQLHTLTVEFVRRLSDGRRRPGGRAEPAAGGGPGQTGRGRPRADRPGVDRRRDRPGPLPGSGELAPSNSPNPARHGCARSRH
jgi:hypothetical protein